MIDKQVGLLPMGVHLSACGMFLQATFSLKGLCIPPSPHFNWVKWLRLVDEWRQVRCSASACPRHGHTDGRLPLRCPCRSGRRVPTCSSSAFCPECSFGWRKWMFTMRKRSTSVSSLLMTLGTGIISISFSRDLAVSFTFKMEFSG